MNNMKVDRASKKKEEKGDNNNSSRGANTTTTIWWEEAHTHTHTCICTHKTYEYMHGMACLSTQHEHGKVDWLWKAKECSIAVKNSILLAFTHDEVIRWMVMVVRFYMLAFHGLDIFKVHTHNSLSIYGKQFMLEIYTIQDAADVWAVYVARRFFMYSSFIFR